MNRSFSTARAECSGSDRTASLRARTKYRDAVNHAVSGGGIKRSRSGIIYAGSVILRGQCLGTGLAPISGVLNADDCAAFFIQSASSYRDLVDITRGLLAGHAETHPASIPAASPYLNSNTFRSVVPVPAGGYAGGAAAPGSAAYPERYNYLFMSSAATNSSAYLLAAVSLPVPEIALYDAAIGGAPSDPPSNPLACMRYPHNPALGLAYGGGGCILR
jgi:hypothetical protein